MDTLSHYTLALLAVMAVGLHRKHKLRYVVMISFLSVLIDLDHFLVPMGYETEYRSMHTIWVATLLPLGLLALSYLMERGSGTDRWQTFFLLMTILLTGHLVTDMISGPIKIYYPFSMQKAGLPYVNIQATPQFMSTVVNNTGIGIAIYAAIVFLGALVHDTMWHARRERKGIKQAFYRSINDYF